MSNHAQHFFDRGWCRFGQDSLVLDWVSAALEGARDARRNPDHARWLRYQQTWFAGVNALFGQFKKFAVDYKVMPQTIYVDPQLARVGLNEREAAEQRIDVEVTTYDLSDLDRAIADGNANGLVKVLTAPGTDRILGATILGPQAGELLTEFVTAMKHNLGLNKILAIIHSYPTLSEANKYVAGEWKRKHVPQRLLVWVEKYYRWKLGKRG